jgi:uncharacterized protein YjbI with pentapeptide repeats
MKPDQRYGIQPPRLPREKLSRLDLAVRLFTASPIDDDNEFSLGLCAGDDLTGLEAVNLFFEQVHFRNVALSRSRLPAVRITDSRFDRCDAVGASWEGATLRRVVFSCCRLVGANWMDSVFEDVLFTDCTLEGANLASITCKAVRFENCILKEVAFEGAGLPKVAFHHCDLTHSDLRLTRLAGTDFRTANISAIQAGVKDLQGAIIHPSQAVQVVGLMGITVKEIDEAGE